MHSSVVEKLSVVDKTLPPDNFYLAKAPSSGQLSVVDKKSGISLRFCCSLFMTFCFSLACIHLLPFKSLIQSVKLSQVEKWSHSVLSFDESQALLNTIQPWQDIHPEGQPESAWKTSHWWKTIQVLPLWQDFFLQIDKKDTSDLKGQVGYGWTCSYVGHQQSGENSKRNTTIT